MYPVGAELFRVDRQTDTHDEATRCFSHFLRTLLQRINYISVMAGNHSKTGGKPTPWEVSLSDTVDPR
jgi:hypothetical protein